MFCGLACMDSSPLLRVVVLSYHKLSFWFLTVYCQHTKISLFHILIPYLWVSSEFLVSSGSFFIVSGFPRHRIRFSANKDNLSPSFLILLSFSCWVLLIRTPGQLDGLEECLPLPFLSMWVASNLKDICIYVHEDAAQWRLFSYYLCLVCYQNNVSLRNKFMPVLLPLDSLNSLCRMLLIFL